MINAIMAGRMQLVFLLAIVTLVCSKFAFEEPSFSTRDEEKVVILDEKIDALLPSVRDFILKHKLDPARIPSIIEDLLPHLPGKFKGKIYLTKGLLKNLSTVKRTKRVLGIYKNKTLTLDLNLGFDILDCTYQYDLQYLFFKRHGNVYGRFYDLDVNIVSRIDLVNYYIYLDSIKFSGINEYDIKFDGHLLDSVLNALTKIVTVIFEKYILTDIEKRSLKIFNEKINEWNNQIPRPNLTFIDEWFNNLVVY